VVDAGVLRRRSGPRPVAGDEEHLAWCVRADEMEELAAEHLRKPEEEHSILEESQ